MAQSKIPITSYGYRVLSKKQQELSFVIKNTKDSSIENQRAVNLAKKELQEVENVLNNSFVRDFDDKNPPEVQIGCSVALENLDKGETREYKIMTRTTANPLKGVISNESPLAQKILGLKLGNTFKFCDNFGKICVFKVRHIE